MKIISFFHKVGSDGLLRMSEGKNEKVKKDPKASSNPERKTSLNSPKPGVQECGIQAVGEVAESKTQVEEKDVDQAKAKATLISKSAVLAKLASEANKKREMSFKSHKVIMEEKKILRSSSSKLQTRIKPESDDLNLSYPEDMTKCHICGKEYSKHTRLMNHLSRTHFWFN